MNLRTCNTCGWVAFAVSLKHARSEVARFNRFFDKLSKQEQLDYYGGRKASIREYKRCMFCSGPYTNFRKAKPGDCPTGCTLSPIVVPPSTQV